MADKPYIEFAPGDLITAEGMNEMQMLICQDIDTKVAEGVAGHTTVENAENAEKLDGKTAEELMKEWLEKALAEIPQRTGYMKVFKSLQGDEPKVIEHNLKACPLVDVYELQPFRVICTVDEDRDAHDVYFYLYHSSEKKLKDPETNTSIDIESSEFPVQFKIPLEEVLDEFKVPYGPDTGLGDLETELWKAMFADPNDDFDMDDYCHSPWFERCCREERTVESIKKKGDWNDLWLKMIPVKTINKPFNQIGNDGNPEGLPISPLSVVVGHFNHNTIGVGLQPAGQIRDDPDGEQEEREARLMLLLKV